MRKVNILIDMGGIMAEQYSFQAVFIEQINDLLSAELLINKALPRYIEVVSSSSLHAALVLYWKETTQHASTLLKILEELNFAISPSVRSVCKTIEGTLEEADAVMRHDGDSPVKDASFIAIIQRLQHYKMAIYGTARTFARHLEYNQAMILLQHALIEEAEADRNLTYLAEGGLFTNGINEEAYKAKVGV